jgi:hypothetical protein
MNVSNLTVNLAILSRSSSNPKLMLGRESAIEGASAEESGGRIMLVESDGSKAVDMVIDLPGFEEALSKDQILNISQLAVQENDAF